MLRGESNIYEKIKLDCLIGQEFEQTSNKNIMNRNKTSGSLSKLISSTINYNHIEVDIYLVNECQRR